MQQYYFYSIPAENLTSVYESTYVTIKNLSDVIHNLHNNLTNLNETDIKINSIEDKLEEVIDNIITWKLTNKDASYKLFNEVNKKQFIAAIYLTRITAIVNKIFNVIENIKIENVTLPNLNETDVKTLESDLSTMQKIFKRRPSEAIAIHFDIITDLLWKNENEFNLVNEIKTMCDNMNNNITKDILNEGKKVKIQICSKQYKVFYDDIKLEEDYSLAKNALNNFVNTLQNNISTDVDIFKVFNERLV